MPRIAPTLVDFVTADDGEYLKWAEAVFRIFDRQDWLRVNRARARIKVLVDKIGIEAMRELVDEELAGRLGRRARLLDRPPPVPPRRGGQRARRRRVVPARRTATARSSSASAQANVERAAPGGLLRRPGQGDPRRPHAGAVPRARRDHARVLAAATRARPCTRTCVLRWVRDEAVYDVWQRLLELGLGDAGADEINDVVSCPGTDSCKLGITSSMGLNRAVQERIEAMDITDPLTRRIHIKMSGCPNGCSQHHIGNIGFYGASIKVGEHTIPAYVAHIGGNYEGGEIVYGARLKVRLPAKRVPEAVERWLRKYEAERDEGEAFNAYAERVGTTRVRGRGARPRHAASSSASRR